MIRGALLNLFFQIFASTLSACRQLEAFTPQLPPPHTGGGCFKGSASPAVSKWISRMSSCDLDLYLPSDVYRCLPITTWWSIIHVLPLALSVFISSHGLNIHFTLKWSLHAARTSHMRDVLVRWQIMTTVYQLASCDDYVLLCRVEEGTDHLFCFFSIQIHHKRISIHSCECGNKLRLKMVKVKAGRSRGRGLKRSTRAAEETRCMKTPWWFIYEASNKLPDVMFFYFFPPHSIDLSLRQAKQIEGQDKQRMMLMNKTG